MGSIFTGGDTSALVLAIDAHAFREASAWQFATTTVSDAPIAS